MTLNHFRLRVWYIVMTAARDLLKLIFARLTITKFRWDGKKVMKYDSGKVGDENKSGVTNQKPLWEQFPIEFILGRY